MIYNITAVSPKSADWKLVDVKEGIEGGKEIKGASVNRTDNKTGAINFKKADGTDAFDLFVEGYTFEAEPWTSPTKGTTYLFAPKPAKPSTGAPRAFGGIAKAQETKAANIEKAQDRKQDAIALAGAFRDATLISLAQLKDEPFPTADEFKETWTYWVRWILSKNNEPFV